jgi:tetratricopeptide (TPR) repeat protein
MLRYRVGLDIPLECLDDQQGSELLLQYVPREQKFQEPKAVELSRKISAEVEGLPLLLVGLAGHIQESHASLRDILDYLQRPWNEASPVFVAGLSESATFQYDRPVQMAFDISLGALSPVALNVLMIMAMLSPDSIPERILVQDLNEPSLKYLGFSEQIRQVIVLYRIDSCVLTESHGLRFGREVRGSLAARHLIYVDAQSGGQVMLSMHRTLQWTIINSLRLNPSRRQQVFDQATEILMRVIPKPSVHMVPVSNQWTDYEQLLPHVLSLDTVFRSASPPIVGTKAFAELLYSAGMYLYERGLSDTGLKILRTAESICDVLNASQKIDSNSTTAIASLNSLYASILAVMCAIDWNHGGLSSRHDTRVRMMKVLELRSAYMPNKAIFGLTLEDRLLASNVLNDMACQFINEEDYESAERYLLDSLAIKANAQEEGHLVPPFEFAESKKNLACVLMAQGKADEAIKLSKDAVDQMATEGGTTHWPILVFRFIWATMLLNAGRFTEALSRHTEVYEARISLLGETNFASLHSCFAVALTEYRLANFKRSRYVPLPAMRMMKCRLTVRRQLLEHCLQDRPGHHWPRECVIRASFLYSLVLESLGEDERAQLIRREARQQRDQMINDHRKGIRVMLPTDGCHEMALFDHLVNSEAGRGSIGRYYVVESPTSCVSNE